MTPDLDPGHRLAMQSRLMEMMIAARYFHEPQALAWWWSAAAQGMCRALGISYAGARRYATQWRDRP